MPRIIVNSVVLVLSLWALVACSEEPAQTPVDRATRSQERRDRALAKRPAKASQESIEAARLRVKGDLLGAIASYDRALALDPDFAVLRLLKATALMEQGEFAAALAECEVVLKADPDDATAFDVRGRIHEAAGQTELARRDYEESLAIKPSEPVAARLQDLQLK